MTAEHAPRWASTSCCEGALRAPSEPPEAPRGEPGLRLEDTAQVALIGEPDAVRHLPERCPRSREQMSGRSDAVCTDAIRDRLAEVPAVRACKGNGVHSRNGGQVAHARRCAETVVHLLDHATKPARGISGRLCGWDRERRQDIEDQAFDLGLIPDTDTPVLRRSLRKAAATGPPWIQPHSDIPPLPGPFGVKNPRSNVSCRVVAPVSPMRFACSTPAGLMTTLSGPAASSAWPTRSSSDPSNTSVTEVRRSSVSAVLYPERTKSRRCEAPRDLPARAEPGSQAARSRASRGWRLFRVRAR